MSKDLGNEKATTEYWNARVLESKGDEIQLVFNAHNQFARSGEIGEGLIKMFAKPGMRVLDAGCGYGRFYQAFRAAGVQYNGVDFSEEMIAEARRRFPDGNFNVGDWFGPFGEYDLVFECICLSSFPSRDMVEFTEVLRKHLAPHGKLIMVEADRTHIVTNDNLFIK